MMSRLIHTLVLVGLVVLAAPTGHAQTAPEKKVAERSPVIRDAFAAYSRRNDGKALRLFHQAIERKDLPQLERAVAHYGAGMVLLHQLPTPDYDEARKHFNTVVSDFGKTDMAPRAMLASVRTMELEAERESNDRDAVLLESLRTGYRKVVDTYPDTDAAIEAHLREGLTYIKTMKLDQVRRALDILNAWTQKHGKHRYASGVYILIGRLYLSPMASSISDKDAAESDRARARRLDYYRKSLDAMVKAVDIGIETYSIRGDVYYRIADVAHYSADRPAVALRFYRRIQDELSTDPRAYLARQRIAELLKSHPELEQ